MAYTVKRLAEISGVSVRTLHFYDEIDLLKPAYLGDNGYRYYEEEQLLMLQQVLFFRELGFELKTIQTILNQSSFDKVKALKRHRQVLRQQNERTQKLIETIDKTIGRLKGERKMKDQEMYDGFDAKKQAGYEDYLINRFGDRAKKAIAESKRKIKGWTKTDWEKSSREWDEICRELTKMMGAGQAAGSAEAQRMIRRHHQWLQQFWTPTKESYAGHGQFILETELRKAYDAYHPALAEFVAKAINIFAEQELA